MYPRAFDYKRVSTVQEAIDAHIGAACHTWHLEISLKTQEALGDLVQLLVFGTQRFKLLGFDLGLDVTQ